MPLFSETLGCVVIMAMFWNCPYHGLYMFGILVVAFVSIECPSCSFSAVFFMCILILWANQFLFQSLVANVSVEFRVAVQEAGFDQGILNLVDIDSKDVMHKSTVETGEISDLELWYFYFQCWKMSEDWSSLRFCKTTYPWDVPLSRLQSIGLRVWNKNTFTLLFPNHVQYTFQSWSTSGDQSVRIWGFNAALNSLSTVPATDGFALQLLDQMVNKQVRSIAPSSVFERSVGHKLTKDWDFS